MPQPEQRFSTSEVLDLLGRRITYRQLDYWCRRAFISPVQGCAGSGTQRRFDIDDIRLVEAAAALTSLGCNGLALRRALEEFQAVAIENRDGYFIVSHEGVGELLTTDELAKMPAILTRLEPCWVISVGLGAR